MEKGKLVLIGGGILALAGAGLLLYKYSSSSPSEEEAGPETKHAKEDSLGAGIIPKEDILKILKKNLGDYELCLATWYKVSLKMAPKNSEQVENFKQTVLTKIKDSIKLTDTTSIKEIGHSYDEFSRALDYYSEDSDISSLLVYIDDNIKRIQNNTKPELKLQEVDGIDEQKFLEFFKLSNKQFLWKMNQKVQEAKPLNKEKIKQIMQSLKPHQNKVDIWTHMELPVHPEMDTACFIKHYQAHIMISSSKVSEEITDIQSRASAKMKEIIRGDYKNEFDEEPLKEHLDHTRASLS